MSRELLERLVQGNRCKINEKDLEELKKVIGDLEHFNFSLKRHDDRCDIDVMMKRKEYEGVCSLGKGLHHGV